MPIEMKSLSSLPNMSDVVESWETEYTAYLISKEIRDYELVETKKKIRIRGVIQNSNGQALNIKELGEREFNNLKLHTTNNRLKNDDIIEVDVGNNEYKRYRIKHKHFDTTYYGFTHYELTEDFVNSTEINVNDNDNGGGDGQP